MWHAGALAAAIAVAQVVFVDPDELDPGVMKWVDAWQTAKAAEIVRLKKAGVPKNRIDRVRNEPPVAPPAEFPLKVGTIATFDMFLNATVLCEEVVDESSFVGRVTEPLQVVSIDRNGIPTLDFPASGPVRHSIIFRNVETSGLKKGAAVVSGQFFLVTAAAGSGAFEAIDLRVYANEWARLNPDAEKPVVKAAPPPRVRSPADEAASKLKSAKVLRAQNREAGNKRLQEIVDKFPDTDAAKEARELLKK